MINLTRLLIRLHPDGGPLFRNDNGRPWNRSSVRCRLRRIKEKVRIPELCAYLWRHSFVTEALERGVSIAAVAELVGHTSTATISRYYSHLDQKAEHLRQAAEAAVADGALRSRGSRGEQHPADSSP
jgi:site-specific recombinase XerD